MSEARITCLGQCGFLLEDGETRVVTDPYLSDAVDRHHPGDPGWRRRYPAPATLWELRPDAVLISHAHDDHMDSLTLSPYAAAGGEAMVCAPAPEAWRLAPMGVKNVRLCRAEERFSIGSARVTPIPCAHTQLHLDGAGRFHELSYLIEFGDNRIFFGGDMSLYDGLLRRLAEAKPNLLLLPVNGRDEERTRNNIIGNIDENEAAELAARLAAPYVPMHHDLYPANGCPVERAEAAARRAGARILPLGPGQTLTIKNGTV